MIVYICSVKLSCQYTCFYTKNELIFATLNRGAFPLLSKNEREMAYLHSKMHILIQSHSFIRLLGWELKFEVLHITVQPFGLQSC